MTQLQVGDRATDCDGIIATVTEVSKCGLYVSLERDDGYTIASSACLVKFVSRFVGYDDEGFATYFLGFQL